MRDDGPARAEQVSTWVSEFLAEHSAAGRTDDDGDLFAESGLDSLGVVNLVTGLESHFRVLLTEGDLQDPRFATVRGLAEIVSEASRRIGG